MLTRIIEIRVSIRCGSVWQAQVVRCRYTLKAMHLKTIVVRPSLASVFRASVENAVIGRRFLGAMLVVLFGGLGGTLAFGRQGPSPVVGIVVAGLGLLIGALVLALLVYVSTTSVSVSGGRITMRRFFSVRQFSAGQVIRVVRRSVVYPLGLAPNKTIFVMNEANRVMLSLLVAYWGEDRLEPLWRSLHVVPEGTWDNQVLYDDVQVEFPAA